jgi:hypothetical protein
MQSRLKLENLIINYTQVFLQLIISQLVLLPPKCFGGKPQPKHVGAVKPIVQLVGGILVYTRHLNRKCIIESV